MASAPGWTGGLRSGDPVAPDAAPWATAAGHGELLKRAGQGDPRAWEALVKLYGPTVHLAAAQHGLSEADVAVAEDTTWLRFGEHLDRLDHEEWLGPWLTRTADEEARRLVARRQLLAGRS